MAENEARKAKRRRIIWIVCTVAILAAAGVLIWQLMK
jgi:flagellar basal body-associated protein FliL